MLLEDTLPKEMDVRQSKGINLSMLVLNMYSCLGGRDDKGQLHPLAEIVNQPANAAVCVTCLYINRKYFNVFIQVLKC